MTECQFGGRSSLDLTWTLRYRAVWPTELLGSPDDLRVWLDAGGLPAPATPTERELADTRALREAIHRAASAVIDKRVIAPADRDAINHWAAHTPPSPRSQRRRDAASIACSESSCGLATARPPSRKPWTRRELPSSAGPPYTGGASCGAARGPRARRC
ncbi:MAG: hypothetical protein F2534_01695 [Actinobacteria bacterium]|nr:hypothetical protein [Actinomycetota bacterium]